VTWYCRLRNKKKCTLETLGKAAGITKQYVWDIEYGRKKLSYFMAYKFSQTLETTPDDLFLEDHKKK